MNIQNKKKLIAIIVIIVIFILFLLFAFLNKKPKQTEEPDVPMGEHGKTEEETVKTNIIIDEKETSFSVNSAELQQAIQNKNSNLSIFGDYYIYDGYYVFPNRNIKISKSYDQIINIIFTNKYSSKIVNSISSNSSKENIIQSLGLPNYNENNLLVYKTKEYYLVFDLKQKQVSAYIRDTKDLNAFWLLYDEYLKNNDLKAYISTLTKYYPSYSKYEYDVDGLELTYANLGIRLFFKQGNKSNGIYIYANYGDYFTRGDEIAELKKKENIYIQDYNLILKDEIERNIYEANKKNFKLPEKIYSENRIYKNINTLNSYLNIKTDDKDKTRNYKELSEMDKYSIYFEQKNPSYTFSNVSVISKTGNNNYNINTAKVADNILLTKDYVFFSIKNEAIFRLNVQTGNIIEIYQGEGDLEIKYLKDNYIHFDDKKVKGI